MNDNIKLRYYVHKFSFIKYMGKNNFAKIYDLMDFPREILAHATTITSVTTTAVVIATLVIIDTGCSCIFATHLLAFYLRQWTCVREGEGATLYGCAHIAVQRPYTFAVAADSLDAYPRCCAMPLGVTP